MQAATNQQLTEQNPNPCTATSRQVMATAIKRLTGREVIGEWVNFDNHTGPGQIPWDDWKNWDNTSK